MAAGIPAAIVLDGDWKTQGDIDFMMINIAWTFLPICDMMDKYEGGVGYGICD